jgi:hypothetical protein
MRWPGDPGRPVSVQAAARPKLSDEFLDRVAEMAAWSEGKIRAEFVHERLAAMEFGGSGRTTRRAVAAAMARLPTGRRCRARTRSHGARCCLRVAGVVTLRVVRGW